MAAVPSGNGSKIGNGRKGETACGYAVQEQDGVALELIDQTLDWGLLRCVVADSYYGNDFGFREQLRSRSLLYAVQVGTLDGGLGH